MDVTATVPLEETLIETMKGVYYVVQNVMADLLGSGRPHIFLSVDGPDHVFRFGFEGDSGVVVLNSWKANTASRNFPH